MISKLVAGLLFIVGLINFIPIVGIVSADKLAKLYGVSLVDNDLIILLRHRALLLGLVGGFVIYSVFKPIFRTAAATLAMISMLGFILVAWHEGGDISELNRVIIADIIALILLIVAFVLSYRVSTD